MNLRSTPASSPGRRGPQPAPPDVDLTCTIRTRFSTMKDLVRAMPILVREDGRLFVPAKDAPVHVGDRLTVVFATIDGGSSVERTGIVESLAPDRTLSGGLPGILVRMLPWD